MLFQVQVVAHDRHYHEASIQGEMGQGPGLHAQDVHENEEALGIPHLPVRLARFAGKSG